MPYIINLLQIYFEALTIPALAASLHSHMLLHHRDDDDTNTPRCTPHGRTANPLFVFECFQRSAIICAGRLQAHFSPVFEQTALVLIALALRTNPPMGSSAFYTHDPQRRTY